MDITVQKVPSSVGPISTFFSRAGTAKPGPDGSVRAFLHGVPRVSDDGLGWPSRCDAFELGELYEILMFDPMA